MTRQCLDMNLETRPGARTKFSPWFGLLHVNLGCFINHNVHELVEALQKMNEGRSAFSYCALESSTENGGRGGANGDVNTKDNFRSAIHPDTTGGGVFKLRPWSVGWKCTHDYTSFNAHLYIVVQPNHDLRPLQKEYSNGGQ